MSLGQDAPIAQMAELVDALGSGPSGGNTVEVRVLFWAPRNSRTNPRFTPEPRIAWLCEVFCCLHFPTNFHQFTPLALYSSPILAPLLAPIQMASITKFGRKWRAQIKLKGARESGTFDTPGGGIRLGNRD